MAQLSQFDKCLSKTSLNNSLRLWYVSNFEAFADTLFSLPPVEDFGLSSTSAENMKKFLKVFLILSLSAYNEEDL